MSESFESSARCWICDSPCKISAKFTYKDYEQQTYDLNFSIEISYDNCDHDRICYERITFSRMYCPTDDINDYKDEILKFVNERVAWYKNEMDLLSASFTASTQCPICKSDYGPDDPICTNCWSIYSDDIEYKTCLAEYNYKSLFERNPHKEFCGCCREGTDIFSRFLF